VETNDGEKIQVLLDRYGIEKIDRIPPITTAKGQGQEAKVSVVVIFGMSYEIDASDLYTGCSRGKDRCIVVVPDLNPSISPDSGRCPSRIFVDIVMMSKYRLLPTVLWKKFPRYEEIASAVKANDLPQVETKRKRRRKNADGRDYDVTSILEDMGKGRVLSIMTPPAAKRRRLEDVGIHPRIQEMTESRPPSKCE
jgi:hypothetical protein